MSTYKLNPYTGNMDLINNSASNTIKVSKDESTLGFHTIKEAMDSINGATVLNPFVINVGPGKYQEIAAIDMKEYVTIIGENEKSTIICAADGENLFNTSFYSTIEKVKLVGATSILVNGYNGSSTCFLHRVTIGECLIGVLNRHIDSRIEYDCAYAETDNGSIGDFIKTTAGLIHLRNATVYGNPVIGNLINADGSTAEVEACNISTLSTNCTNSYYINNGGTIGVFNALNSQSTNGIRIGADGVGSSFMGRSIDFRSTSKDIYNESATADINLIAVNMSRGLIDSVCDFNATGWDPTEGKFKYEGDLSIGLDGCGHSLEVGEGGAYKYGVHTLTWDGVNGFNEIAYGDDISFSALGNGSCIYFGDYNENGIFGLEYLMGDTAIDMGTGELLWEYYDGFSTWTPFDIMCTLHDGDVNYNQAAFAGIDGTTYTVRFDQDIENGVKEFSVDSTGHAPVSVNGETAMWVRCRIEQPIDVSPKFSAIRLKGNYQKICANGGTAYHGSSRAIRSAMLPFGDIGAGAASANAEISSNITIPLWNNSLPNLGTTELYFRYVINSEIDTSCGISFNYTAFADHTGGVDRFAQINSFFSVVNAGAAFDGTNSEFTWEIPFYYTALEATKLRHDFRSEVRVDISNCQPGDIVFVMLQRDAASDDLPASVVLTNAWIEHKIWKKGSKLV
jgi:hypothetical protein